MTVATRLGVFGLGLAAAFTAAWGVGQAIGEPPPEPAAAEHDDMGAGDPTGADAGETAEHGGGPDESAGSEAGATGGHGDTAGSEAGATGGHGETDAEGHDEHGAEDVVPSGLAISERGYTFHLMSAPTAAAAPDTLTFHILGPDGVPVTEFDIEHEKPLHLIIANRELTEFQHLHPQMDADGLWTVPVTLPSGGAYRAFADFVPTGGDGLTLGADLLIAGQATADAPAAPAVTSQVDDFEITLDGHLVAGEPADLTFTVTRNGSPVELEPYLGADGHLVILRSGDLAYLHAHPQDPATASDQAGDATVAFSATAPSVGTYRLFLDFQVDGVVRTASFSVTVDAAHEH